LSVTAQANGVGWFSGYERLRVLPGAEGASVVCM
jgi:hypothetical protein